jgi:hypothetical protein
MIDNPALYIYNALVQQRVDTLGCDCINKVMNYHTHYTLLIERAKVRTLTIYKEAHHIIPKCLGGTDDPNNLVDLTAREHYVAHILLAKIHGGTLWHAVNLMGRKKKYTNRYYEKARIEHSKLLSAQNKRIKSKPKETRQYTCLECSKIFNKLEFCHHPLKGKPFCTQSCAARNTAKNNIGRKLVIKNPRVSSWNKGISNPQAAENARKGAAKLSDKVKGRKRLYKEDGTWTWQYP